MAATTTATGAGTPVTDPMNPAAAVDPTATPTGIIATQQAGNPPAAATQAVPSSDVANWYRTVYGRDPDQGGLDYWNKQIASGGNPNDIFKGFQNAGSTGVEKTFNSGVTQAQAGTYDGRTSGEQNTNVDEWARNNGVTMTPAQKAQYETAYNTASTGGSVKDSKAVYAQFLADHPGARGLDYSTAQQLNYQLPSTPGVVDPGNGSTTQAAQYQAAQLGDPTKWNVTANQTAQGQMANMIDPNSPYYQAWAHAGAADAAARGFTGNSSIRDSSILDSVMRNATPIATNDAATYAKSGSYNADINNQFAVHNQDANNNANQFNAGQVNQRYGVDLNNATQRYGIDTNNATQRYGIDTNASTSLATANISAGTQKYVAGLSSDTQKAVAGLNNASQAAISTAHDTNSTLIQTNQNAASAYHDYVNAVTNVQIQPNMSEAAKQTSIDNLGNTFQSTMDQYKAANSGIITGQRLPDSQTVKSTTDTSTESKDDQKGTLSDAQVADNHKAAVDAANATGVDVGDLVFFGNGHAIASNGKKF